MTQSGHSDGQLLAHHFRQRVDQAGMPSEATGLSRTLKLRAISDEMAPRLPAKFPSVSIAPALGCGGRVSEEIEGTQAGSEGPIAGVDPVAVTLALGGADPEIANAFLKKQSVLVEKQSNLADLRAKELGHELE